MLNSVTVIFPNFVQYRFFLLLCLRCTDKTSKCFIRICLRLSLNLCKIVKGNPIWILIVQFAALRGSSDHKLPHKEWRHFGADTQVQLAEDCSHQEILIDRERIDFRVVIQLAIIGYRLPMCAALSQLNMR
jgi:hypothetical protein